MRVDRTGPDPDRVPRGSRTHDPGEILKPPLRRGVQSTLFVLGGDVPRAWGDFYHKNLTKDEMVITEQHSGEIGRWGKVKHCRERRVESLTRGGVTEEDVYRV